jgi:3-oxoacyl-[acyl-carrier-protein] synthase-3
MKIASYLPLNTLENDAIKSEMWPAEKILAKTGIRSRHICAKDEFALDLAQKACEKLFEDGVDKSKIDYVIYCTQSPDTILPNNVSVLQDRLGLNENIGCFDFNQGCTGFVYGLSIAKGLLISEQASHVLLVTTDTYSKYLSADNLACRTLFGDGSTATLLTIDDAKAIGKFVFGTSGKGADLLKVPQFGLRNHSEGALSFFMNGPRIFSFTLDRVPTAVNELLENEKMTLSDIDHVIFHQANGYILEHLRQKLNIPQSKFHTYIENVGNTVSSSIPLTLEHCLKNQTIRAGESILLVGFGIGLSWNATLIQMHL